MYWRAKRVDKNKNLRKLSYAALQIGLRAKPKAWKLRKKPHGRKEGESRDKGREGRWVCVNRYM